MLSAWIRTRNAGDMFSLKPALAPQVSYLRDLQLRSRYGGENTVHAFYETSECFTDKNQLLGAPEISS